MADQLQFRRGTTAQTGTFTGAIGEVTVDTSKSTVVVHDGATAGGFPALTESDKVELLDGSKNVLIGNFYLNQRQVSGTVVLTAGQYGHDRFRAGSGGCTYTFSVTAGITEISISAGTIEQEVHGINIQSGDYILSWSGTAQGQIDGGGFAASGVAGTLTGGINSIVEWGTGTLSLPQLEKGTVVTSFDFRDIGEELALSKRYYNQFTTAAAVMAIASGFARSTSIVDVVMVLPVELRAIPTVTIGGASSPMAILHGPTTTDSNSVVIVGAGTQTFRLAATATSGAPFTVGEGVLLVVNSTSPSFISFDAEL